MLGIDKLLLKRVFTFAARRGLSALGLLLIERGWVDANDWSQLALALAPILADLAWSLYEKAKADKKLAEAKAEA
jgi:hypothetical protein